MLGRLISYAIGGVFVLTLLVAAFAPREAVVEDPNHALHKYPMKISWAQDGVFGTFDREQLQRGFQVYKEVCATCHSVERLAFRNLVEYGAWSEAEVKAMAEEIEIVDGPNDEGEMFERPGKLSDPMPGPYANEEAARAANNGALPPDLSLIVKARHGGAEIRGPPAVVQQVERQLDVLHVVVREAGDGLVDRRERDAAAAHRPEAVAVVQQPLPRGAVVRTIHVEVVDADRVHHVEPEPPLRRRHALVDRRRELGRVLIHDLVDLGHHLPAVDRRVVTNLP